MKKNAKIFLAGYRGLVGSALLRRLQKAGYKNILTRTRKELELLNQAAVETFFAEEKPEYVFLAAAKVGGIMANKTQKAEFIYENLQLQNNVIHAAWKHGVKKLLFLGSSCIYPKLSPQPIKEEFLLTGPLEETNDAYAVAKIAGIVMCQSYNSQYGTNFISVMPTNLYGPNDNFDLKNSHVLPALIRKFHEAKINNKPSVTLWGTGEVFREFLHVDDLADACLFLMENYDSSEIINIGTGQDMTIKQLAETVQEIVGYEGEIKWDRNKPNGTPRKQLDMTKLTALGWKPKIQLATGLQKVYDWFKEHYDEIVQKD
ncbi:MAG TPA: GDP-L-fucose synthase [Vitreimonas sp.]|nr:GDP-L-fucose synthase [Vitreimonas sp.]